MHFFGDGQPPSGAAMACTLGWAFRLRLCGPGRLDDLEKSKGGGQ
jgi:hypothetical protein